MKTNPISIYSVRSRAFSLVEMLVVIALIGVVAAVAVPQISEFQDTASKQKGRRNGQLFCEQFSAARAAGAPFTGSTKEAILDELIAGVTGTLIPSHFAFSLGSDEKADTLDYCSYDGATDTMKYHPEGGQGSGEAWSKWMMVMDGVSLEDAENTRNYREEEFPIWQHRISPSDYGGYKLEYREPR